MHEDVRVAHRDHARFARHVAMQHRDGDALERSGEARADDARARTEHLGDLNRRQVERQHGHEMLYMW